MDDADAQLVMLVSILNRSPGGFFSITVWTGGAVLTGMAITSAEYWRRMADAVKDPTGGDGSPTIRDIYTIWADREATAALDPEPAEDEILPEASFLHLKDAQIVADGVPATTGMLWRARLSSIDAWTLSLIPAQG